MQCPSHLITATLSTLGLTTTMQSVIVRLIGDKIVTQGPPVPTEVEVHKETVTTVTVVELVDVAEDVVTCHKSIVTIVDKKDI